MMFEKRKQTPPEAPRPAEGATGGIREDPGIEAALLGADPYAPREALHRIGRSEVARAIEILNRYKQGKRNLEERIVQDELWWELRHWEVIRRGKGDGAQAAPEPTSAWLFNAILNKHADAMDNYPEPVVLPRERSDEGSAKILSSVLPVILEQNDYEQTYSDNWWEKLKHGTAAYGVFWNNQKENGLGDIDIRPIDLLKLFWEPGVTDIQKSRNLFLVELVDEEVLEEQYPQYKGKLGGGAVDVKQYIYDDTVDVSHKSVVVDWYYKVRSPGGRTVLHYAKFVGDTLLFASENEAEYQEKGWYDHGLYPVVLDVMFPEKGTPVGFGYVAICKDPQLYIDRLSSNILETAMMGTKRRYFASTSTNINKEQFLDWKEPIVDVEGELDDKRLQEITVRPLDGVFVNVLQMKIEELKDTAANRDVNSGGTGGGVTAASAIAALQEAGNKVSRDMISTSYRAYTALNSMCIELIRQFYDETRSFRITGGAPGEYRFAEVNNGAIRDQAVSPAYPGEERELYRRPVFDIRIIAQKKNPFSRMEQNERAKELYKLGFFNPKRAQEALGALEMMEFDGREKVVEQIQQGKTMMDTMEQMGKQMEQMGTLLQAATGASPGEKGKEGLPAGQPPQGGQEVSPGSQASETKAAGASPSPTGEILRAHTPITGYGERLAKRSRPKI